MEAREKSCEHFQSCRYLVRNSITVIDASFVSADHNRIALGLTQASSNDGEDAFSAFPQIDDSPPRLTREERHARFEAEQQAERDEFEHGRWRCICDNNPENRRYDLEQTESISCNGCNTWQHRICMGYPEADWLDEYCCEDCKPDQHLETLATVEQGRKIWSERQKRYGEIRECIRWDAVDYEIVSLLSAKEVLTALIGISGRPAGDDNTDQAFARLKTANATLNGVQALTTNLPYDDLIFFRDKLRQMTKNPEGLVQLVVAEG